VKKLLLLTALFAFASISLFAQDDELPPPTSKPKTDYNNPQYPLNGKADTLHANTGFQGFSGHKKIDLSKFIIEPDFNFNISGDEIDLGVSPYVGYNVWKGLCLGGGVTYLYSGFRNIPFQDASGRTYYANAKYETYGGGVFAQYNIWKGFFARVKFEVLHRDMDDLSSNNISIQLNPNNNSYQVVIPKIQATIPDMLVGVGYNLLRSKNFFFPIIVSYNVLSSVTNPAYSVYPHNWVIQLGFVNVF
jgi:hypothetical protein